MYRLFALCFALGGVALFCFTYFKQSENGGMLGFFHDPFAVVFLVFPFLPAIVFSFMAKRAEKKLQEIVKE